MPLVNLDVLPGLEQQPLHGMLTINLLEVGLVARDLNDLADLLHGKIEGTLSKLNDEITHGFDARGW